MRRLKPRFTPRDTKSAVYRGAIHRLVLWQTNGGAPGYPRGAWKDVVSSTIPRMSSGASSSPPTKRRIHQIITHPARGCSGKYAHLIYRGGDKDHKSAAKDVYVIVTASVFREIAFHIKQASPDGRLRSQRVLDADGTMSSLGRVLSRSTIKR